MTAEVVRQAAAYVNPLGERELSLRGLNFPDIENLGVTEDQYELIDFSDNELITLSNFPLLKRLQTIIANNNRIAELASGLGKLLPKMQNLILTNNKIDGLESLKCLASMSGLERVSFLNNPVAKDPNYRMYLIHLLPKLKVIDFTKVKPAERKVAQEKYGKLGNEVKESGDQPMDTEESSDAKTFIPGAVPTKVPTAEQKKKILEAIKNASSLEEMDRLEEMLRSGKVPASFDA